MPHMSPISWTLILFSSLAFIILLSSMIYFSVSHKKNFLGEKKVILKREVKWEW